MLERNMDKKNTEGKVLLVIMCLIVFVSVFTLLELMADQYADGAEKFGYFIGCSINVWVAHYIYRTISK